MNEVTKDILKRYLKKEKDLFKTIQLDELGCIVDDGVELDVAEKKAKKELAPIKEMLLAYSKNRKEKRHAGFKGFALIKRKTSSSISPKDLLKYLINVDKKKLFMSLIKVGVTDAKKFLGEEALKDILKVETDDYGKVEFKGTKD